MPGLPYGSSIMFPSWCRSFYVLFLQFVYTLVYLCVGQIWVRAGDLICDCLFRRSKFFDKLCALLVVRLAHFFNDTFEFTNFFAFLFKFFKCVLLISLMTKLSSQSLMSKNVLIINFFNHKLAQKYMIETLDEKSRADIKRLLIFLLVRFVQWIVYAFDHNIIFPINIYGVFFSSKRKYMAE